MTGAPQQQLKRAKVKRTESLNTLDVKDAIRKTDSLENLMDRSVNGLANSRRAQAESACTGTASKSMTLNHVTANYCDITPCCWQDSKQQIITRYLGSFSSHSQTIGTTAATQF